VNCFDSPAYLRGDSLIGKYFFQLVKDPSEHQDTKCTHDYRETLTIKITEDIFLRRGYVLSKTDIRSFNNFVEDHLKQQAWKIIDTILEMNSGTKINEAIDFVYEKYGMDENVWPYETIKKGYYRHRQSSDALTVK
jgi:hypothetical protein